MSNKSIPKLVIHTIGGSSFAVIDARQGNHIIKEGFKTWEQARAFVEAFYLERALSSLARQSTRRVLEAR